MYSLRRAKSLLGTIVEITVEHSKQEVLLEILNKAFKEISFIQSKLSRFTVDSDISRLNSLNPGDSLEMHAYTLEILGSAKELSQSSAGIFDPCYASAGKLDALEFSPEGKGRIAQNISCDLGGFAKGFAVDKACDLLRSESCSYAMVNAGGDLRVFGDKSSVIQIRCPEAHLEKFMEYEISSQACATSGQYNLEGAPPEWPGIVDPIKNLQMGNKSVSVFASTCMLADGLTKVVSLNENIGAKLLRKYNARALIQEVGNSPRWIGN